MAEELSLLASDFQVGAVVAGKYRIERVLGVGGMGAVLAAHHLHLDQKVAIKVLLPGALEGGEALTRFLREARAAVKITSEHVARVSDVGTTEQGAPYMVMEHLTGSDLATHLEERGHLPVDQAVDFLLQACEALAEAHVLGIVHRDLKPANLFLITGADGLPCIKVLDFGISKLTSQAFAGADVAVTRTATVIGSPLYMSPEQLRALRGVDQRTDIWSLGVVLFEFITGSPPFTGSTLPEVCIQIATQAPPSLRQWVPEAPVKLEQIILKCLEKDRDQRFGSVAELARALGEVAPPRARASVERILRVMRSSLPNIGTEDSLRGGTVPLLTTPTVDSPNSASNPVPQASNPVSRNSGTWARTASERRSPSRWIIGGAIATVAALGVFVAGAWIVLGGLFAARQPAASVAAASLDGGAPIAVQSVGISVVPAIASQPAASTDVPTGGAIPTSSGSPDAGAPAASPSATATPSVEKSGHAPSQPPGVAPRPLRAPGAPAPRPAASRTRVYDEWN